uniref:Uncharacterized protein n=1 Tax=Rhizophora mucronata TaxID=61149 RepID=A0A2P2NSA3_RHIMU
MGSYQIRVDCYLLFFNQIAGTSPDPVAWKSYVLGHPCKFQL